MLTLDALAAAIWGDTGDVGFITDWRALAESCAQPAGQDIVRQLHPAGAVYILRSGDVRYGLMLEGSRESLTMGSDNRPGLPLGWSAMVAPNRYATSAQAITDCEMFAWPIAALQALFERHPRAGTTFYSYVFARMQPLLDRTRQALQRTPLAAEMLRRSLASMVVAGAGKEPAADEVLRLLRESLFFEGFDDSELQALAGSANPRQVAAGDCLYREGDDAEGLMLLRQGFVEISIHNPDQGRDVFLRSYSTPGQVVAGSSFSALKVHRESARAVSDSSVVHIPRGDIEALCQRSAKFALRLEQRWVWLLSARLRTFRLHLLAQQNGNEEVVIQDLLGLVSPQLNVDSPLYKLPHLLASRLTHAEAFVCLDRMHDDGDALERALSTVIGELLAGLRREQRFFEGLNRVYRVVTSAAPETDPADVRRGACIAFQQAFKHVRHVIRGQENLPREPGHLFILNHLVSFPGYALANGFEFALDTHFVSSMILEPAYGDSGVRVVRRGRGEEHGHQRYYDRLGHIYVLTAESDAVAADADEIAARRQRFTRTCADVLNAGSNLIICPEGTSNRLQDSPSPFKKGTFHLAAALRPEPLIVPVSIVNIDRTLKNHRIGAVIQRPFRISEVCDPGERDSLQSFLDRLGEDYRGWISDALTLADAET